MADQTQRIEIATVRAEVGSNIVFRFANDAANADSIPTQSGDIKNLKQVVLEIQEDASDRISISTTIYPTVAAGLAATTDQSIFLVQSNDADEIYTVWKNESGTAVNTGKTALSATAIQTALDASNEAAQAAEDAAEVAVSRTARYLAPSDTPPVVRDNGLPLEVGDIWFNLVEQAEYRYTDTGWQANESQQAISDLGDETDPEKGAMGIGWDGDRLGEQLDFSKKINNYDQLRIYFGSAKRVEIMRSGISGVFQLDINDTFSIDNGGTVIVGAGGRRWKRQYYGDVDARWFEAVPGEDATNSLQRTIFAAEAKGSQIISVEDSLDLLSQLEDRSRVFMRGEGRLTGTGSYRKQVFSWNAQSGRQFFNDLEPAKHLQRFSVARSPSVVLVGSSTGAWSPNSIDTASTVARMLADRIARYNPEKNVKFYNRCIGAQSYDQLDGIPTLFPAWYTDHAKPWLDYIKDLSPDVVFIIMGSGDSGAMSYTRLKSVTDKINAFTKVPDIVYITQPSVNPDPHPNYAAFGTKDALEGRDYAAGLIRSFAQYNKYGMIDANRVGGIVLDGRDLLDTISERKVSGQAISGGEYSSPYNAHDFSFRVEFPGDAAAIDTYFLNAANPVFFRVGAGLSDLRGGDIVFVRKNGSGNFRFELFAKNAGNYAVIDTQVAFPTGPFSLDVFKSGNTVGVSVANAEDTAFMMFPIIAHGGEFSPQFGCRNGGGPFSVLAYLNLGTPKQYLPALTSQQAWGEKSAGATTQYPYGGNGVNHFSSLGTTFIYGPLLNREVLSAARMGDGTYTPVVGDVTNTVAPVPGVAMWSRSGDTVTVNGAVSITPQASGIVQVDLSLPVPSNLAVPADLAGTCGAGGIAGMSGSVWGNDAADRARIQLTTTVTSAQNVRYTYSYRIK
ncbi:hypothetical protein PPUJ13061_31810 [Pseudomonas putida]|uniref:hypothetical protein n=1 Tax=Pseudomonas putida TaxID=303 RepID=UPI000E0D5303|nr:hypothetical protein [Pseudomonas putida]WQE51577.1 hypothetical protein U0028_16970 [Pseudomonas putida]GLO03283.1 hypothetical protein PPUJ13061_31810 [Pseudomonas putida]HDS1005809.1 hypothetical protein [Pseudomonas putida]